MPINDDMYGLERARGSMIMQCKYCPDQQLDEDLSMTSNWRCFEVRQAAHAEDGCIFRDPTDLHVGLLH